MDLALSEFQQMLKDSARDVLTRECPRSLVRAVEKDSQRFADKLWNLMGELGWPGLALPEEHGGSGASFSDIVILLEEMGKALPPVPFITNLISGLAISHFGTPEQKKQYLPGIARGKIISSLALLEEDGSYNDESIRLKARPSSGGYILEGAKLFVPYGEMANIFLVAGRTNRKDEGLTFFIVAADSPGISTEPLVTIALDKQSRVTFGRVKMADTAVLGGVDRGGEVLEMIMDWGATARSAEMAGIAQQVFDMAKDYTRERVQFEKQIGAFQIVQGYIADMAMDVDGGRYSTWEAAWRLSEGLPATAEASVAKAWTSEACRRVVLRAHEILGGVGFMEDHNLQLFTRRAKIAEVDFGDATFHREKLARVLAQGQAKGIFSTGEPELLRRER